MTLDLSNPLTFLLFLLVAVAAVTGFFFFVREILVSAALEVKRREKEQAERERIERGRRL